MPEIGQTISHYRILEQLGKGGMGNIFLTEDLTLDYKVICFSIIGPDSMLDFIRTGSRTKTAIKLRF